VQTNRSSYAQTRMPLAQGPHLDLLLEAIATEGRGQRALLDGDERGARTAMRDAAQLYRESWQVAPPASYGRLIGMLKAAVIAGDASAEATYAQAEVPADAQSAPVSYARAIVALVQRDDATAAADAAGMRNGSPAFERAADAIVALAAHDAPRYAAAVSAIVADFEQRDEHLTGVPIADTALMLERFAQARGIAARPASALLPR
jgi:hypothetical protein